MTWLRKIAHVLRGPRICSMQYAWPGFLIVLERTDRTRVTVKAVRNGDWFDLGATPELTVREAVVVQLACVNAGE